MGKTKRSNTHLPAEVLIKRLAGRYLRPYVKILLIAIVLMIVSSGLTGAFAKFVEPLMNNLFVQHRADLIVPMGFEIFLIFFFNGIATYGYTVMMVKIGQSIIADMQADLLWAAEQIVRSQAFGGVLIWLNQVRPGALRRLQVLAQSGESAIWVFRPAQALRESSPAVLRLGLAPAGGDALSIVFHKRRGPLRESPLQLPLADPLRAGRAAVRPLPVQPAEPFTMDPATAALLAVLSSSSSSAAFDALSDASDHAVLDRGASAPSAPRRASTPVV